MSKTTAATARAVRRASDALARALDRHFRATGHPGGLNLYILLARADRRGGTSDPNAEVAYLCFGGCSCQKCRAWAETMIRTQFDLAANPAAAADQPLH